MGNHNSSLALEEMNERVETELDLLVQARHLSISSASAEVQPLFRVVKVSGSITISF